MVHTSLLKYFAFCADILYHRIYSLVEAANGDNIGGRVDSQEGKECERN